ncbi:MAG: transposase, partial [Sphingobacterium sp.]
MQAKKKISNQSSFFFSLEDTLSARYSLYILNNRVDWRLFEIAVSPMYCLDNGRPAKPIRLMVSLLIMKHIRNVSDESAVEQ